MIYGDTDSIMPCAGGRTESECAERAMEIKLAVETAMRETPFAEIKIDVKGNYETFVITAKKKYAAIKWDGTMEKDVIPVARRPRTGPVIVMATGRTGEEAGLTMYLAGSPRPQDLLPVETQLAEKRINCQPLRLSGQRFGRHRRQGQRREQEVGHGENHGR